MLTQYEEKMQKSVENLEAEYATIRAGRANPNILNKIKVEYYGVPTPMQQLANITVPEARILSIFISRSILCVHILLFILYIVISWHDNPCRHLPDDLIHYSTYPLHFKVKKKGTYHCVHVHMICALLLCLFLLYVTRHPAFRSQISSIAIRII